MSDGDTRNETGNLHFSTRRAKSFTEEVTTASQDYGSILELKECDKIISDTTSSELLKSTWRRASIVSSATQSRIESTDKAQSCEQNLNMETESLSKSKSAMSKSSRRASMSEIPRLAALSPTCSPRAIVKRIAKPALEKICSPMLEVSAVIHFPGHQGSSPSLTACRTVSPPPMARRAPNPTTEKLSSAIDSSST